MFSGTAVRGSSAPVRKQRDRWKETPVEGAEIHPDKRRAHEAENESQITLPIMRMCPPPAETPISANQTREPWHLQNPAEGLNCLNPLKEFASRSQLPASGSNFPATKYARMRIYRLHRVP